MGSSDPANDGTQGYAFDDFERLDRIGAGGTADVYRARVKTDDGSRSVALKTPRLSDYETVDASFFDAFVEEASIWNRIDDHDHIVSVLDWGTEPYPWIAMEYMDAGHLGDRAADLPRERRVGVFQDVCNAVFHAHRHGITHGDLKPENVLLTSAGGELTPKVGDWGLAKVLLDHSRSRDGLTMAYSAPEQIDPDAYGATNDRTDVYQLSAVAYELFVGAPPFEAEGTGALVHRILNDRPTPPSERADVPAALDDAILRGLSKDPDDRYETVLYLRDAVEEAMAEPDRSDTDDASTAPASAATTDTPANERESATTTSRTGRSKTTTDTDRGSTQSETAVEDRTPDPSPAVTTDREPSRMDRTRHGSRDDGTSGTDAGASEASGSSGLLDRLRRPVESMDHGRGVVRSISFALNYPRATDRRSVANWWLVAFASILVVPAPLMVGFFLETIRQADTARAPTLRLGDGRWRRHYRRGLVGFVLLFGPFLAFAAVADPNATSGSSGLEGVLAMVNLVTWVLLPGLLSEYATADGLSALASADHWRRYASLRYVGTLLGTVVAFLLAYLVMAGIALTIVGIAVAYFYLMVAMGGFLGRRARPD